MQPIDIARSFIQLKVLQPALATQLPDKIRNKILHSNIWLNRFNRVGDLLAYLKRFDASKDNPTYRELKALGLLTFEDIVSEFEAKFSQWAQDCTRLSDFIIGNEYSVYDILILARNYDTRSGGMFVLEADGKPSAVVIKASLSGGKYANEWIECPTRLKYYLKSIDGNFGESYKTNAAIINTPHIPILTFVRNTEQEPFVFRGVFNYNGLHKEEDGSKWFDLELALDQPREVFADAEYIIKNLADSSKVAMLSSREERLARLKTAPKKPTPIKVISTAYVRNPDVVAEVLFRSNGVCEGCHEPAPFMRKSDGSPYLEVHHIIPLAAKGDDTVENGIALCPNCHRRSHFG